jgi:maltooligosyltrehalose trehalohydrolase
MSIDFSQRRSLGATYLDDGRYQFCVWAPLVEQLEVQLILPTHERFPLEKDDIGYHVGTSASVVIGSRYFCRLNGVSERPDPASRFQPEGVHGPSEVVDAKFSWEDHGWNGLALRDYIIYELHVGAYTREGTFDAVIPHLEELKDLGITAVEIMPVGQFPGGRNWGYDGVYPFAVQNSYGGPQGLKRLVNACHRTGLAVILDVVYNHLGPEGNYLNDFSPYYFTERYKTPWGPALNFDGPYSDEVRYFFIENARYWIDDFHIDALRLDAVHAILDHSPQPFLEELGAKVHKLASDLNRRVYLMPESAANDARLIRSRERGGYGLDAVWSDDFHHALRALLTGEHSGYYEDYGKFEHLVDAYRDGFAYSGEYSRFRKRRHGSSAKDIPAERFIVFSQNHDQVGNRLHGDRLTHSVCFEALKLAAATVILSPFIPLIFMGEEYGETAPFPYFISHSDAGLIEAVRRGRRAEFAAFQWQGEIPDPQDEATFLQAQLRHEARHSEGDRVLYEFYRELFGLRKTIPALANLNKDTMDVRRYDNEQVLFVHRWSEDGQAIIIESFSGAEGSVSLPIAAGHWRKILDSTDKKWQGGGSSIPKELHSDGAITLSLVPRSAVVFTSIE